MTKVVTERDFRKAEFIDADPKDYEFRGDGKVIRKDRWEKGIRNIVTALGLERSIYDWEIEDVVFAVKRLVNNLPTLCHHCGCEMTDYEEIDYGFYCASCNNPHKSED